MPHTNKNKTAAIGTCSTSCATTFTTESRSGYFTIGNCEISVQSAMIPQYTIATIKAIFFITTSTK